MRDRIYTQLAGQAIELSSMFALLVGSTPIPCAGGVLAIELTKPHGPSTGGGVQALQHVTFVHGDITIVVGSLDQTTKKIELRAFDNVAAQYQARWKKQLLFERHAYDAFIARVRVFAKNQGFVVAIKHSAEPVAAPPARNWNMIAIVLVVIAIAVGVVVYIRW